MIMIIVFKFSKYKYKLLFDSIDGQIALYVNTQGAIFLNIMDDYSNIIDVTFDDSEYLCNYFLFNKTRNSNIKPKIY